MSRKEVSGTMLALLLIGLSSVLTIGVARAEETTEGPTEMQSQRSILLGGAPNITVLSPENITYAIANVSLTFSLNETCSWIGYCLDGQANVTITGNTTLTDLSVGLHNVTVYANNTAGDMGFSETVYFMVLPYDLNGDRVVNMKDIGIAALAYGSFPDHLRWNFQADLNCDGEVSLRDLGLIALNYGTTYP